MSTDTRRPTTVAAPKATIKPARKKIWRGLNLTTVACEQFADRFWAKVDPTGDCWEWTAYRKNNGYGQFTLRKGVFVGAHTVSYALTHGPIPAGYVICHRCDNPPCVNPDHLFLGTQSSNAFDMFFKGRATRSRGTERANARLSDDDVLAIRSAPARYGLLRDLARQYGVSDTTIKKVRSGEKWRHVA